MPDEAEHDKLVMSLLESAIAQAPEQRDKYLRSSCGTDDALYLEVRGLVEWEVQHGSFMREPILRLTSDAAGPFAAGDLLAGRFRIMREVARGGMGVVYEACDETLDRRIAVKCALLGFRGQLPPEARAAREVSHYNVCKVHDLHTAETPHGEIEFLTMEFIDGGTLSARLKQAEPLPRAEVRDIVRQVAAGLAQAHRQGVIHGDIKPANILLCGSPEGSVRAVLTDFGLAKMQQAGGPHRMSAAGGTLRYMAPELITGGRATVSSDLFALGVVIREMLGGEPDKFWKAIVRRCTAADPKDRVSSVEELTRALAPRRVLIPLLAGLAGVLAIIVSYLAWAANRPAGPPARLAILPLELTGPPADSLPGVAVEVARLLSRVRQGLVVISPGDLRQYHVDTPRQASRTLAATHALVTRVEHRGGKMLMKASLVDADSGTPVREVTGTYSDADAPALARALAATVTGGLKVRSNSRPEEVLPQAYRDYTAGMALLRRDKTSGEAAIPLFEKATQIDSRSALPLAGLAEAQLQLFRQTRAAHWLKDSQANAAKARSLNPDAASVYLIDGELQSESGRYEQAAQMFARAAELEPGNPDGWGRLALAYEHMNRPADALATFRRAITAQPRYFLHYLNLFRFHWNRGEYPQAEETVRQLVGFAPDFYAGHTNLGSVLIDQGRFAEAESEIQASLHLRETPIATYLLGWSRFYQRRYAEAVAPLERALQIGIPGTEDFLTLGHVYRYLGRAAQARDAYGRGLAIAEEAVTRNPREALVRSQLAVFAALLGDRKRASYEIAQALEMAPDADKLIGNAAMTYELLHRREDTLALFSRAPLPLVVKLMQEPDFDDLQRDSRFRALLAVNHATP